MPRIKAYKDAYMVNDVIENLKWECKRFGFTQKQQGEVCGCSGQNIAKAYRNQSMSLRQYLLISSRLDEIKASKESKE